MPNEQGMSGLRPANIYPHSVHSGENDHVG